MWLPVKDASGGDSEREFNGMHACTEHHWMKEDVSMKANGIQKERGTKFSSIKKRELLTTSLAEVGKICN